MVKTGEAKQKHPCPPELTLSPHSYELPLGAGKQKQSAKTGCMAIKDYQEQAGNQPTPPPSASY